MRWALLVALLLPACGSEAPAFPSEMGFISVDPEPAAPATGHMFYVLLSADSDPGKKPLFVFFNGGPGVPTSTNLLVDATGPEQFIVDAAGQGSVVDNAASFTKLGRWFACLDAMLARRPARTGMRSSRRPARQRTTPCHRRARATVLREHRAAYG